jgi:pyridoxine 5-phosphate synthase
LREARKTYEPDPVHAAIFARLGGADGITVHIRSDRRHIKERDASLIKEIIELPLTVEMGFFDDILRFVKEDLKPAKVTLVPEREGEVTTEGGLDVVTNLEVTSKYIKELLDAGIAPGIFVDPVEKIVEASCKAGAVFIEINTTSYALAQEKQEKEEKLSIIKNCAEYGKEIGLAIHAGHALNLWNVTQIAQIPQIEEFSIGHSIVSRSIFVGFERAVREMKEAILRGARMTR